MSRYTSTSGDENEYKYRKYARRNLCVCDHKHNGQRT